MSDEFSVNDMMDTLKTLPKRKIALSASQMEIVNHDQGPLWIIAGPGSGKTEALVLRCLKLLLVDRVDPRSIIITTFTEKAGRNLHDRLILYKDHIEAKYSWAKDVDLTQLRVGTLHSLCNDILLEYRFPGYLNVRTMDDMEQLLFIYFHTGLAKKAGKNLAARDMTVIRHFAYILDPLSQRSMKRWGAPSRWARARLSQSLFNRVVEYRLNKSLMISRGGVWKTLASEFMEYEEALRNNYRVDFAHMQSKLLDFLSTPLGLKFVEGGAKPNDPGITHVLVDEYQDTNPIQAEIYFGLASRKPHNLVVVGDDDQALYRFRGGTVESMIAFDKMCKQKYGIDPRRVSLVENYRSHPQIVQLCNEFITSFGTMKRLGARVAKKPPLAAKSTIGGAWSAASLITSKTDKGLAAAFADTIQGLYDNKIIEDYSKCVLLIHSTRESNYWTKHYAEALRARSIPIYNPRSRQFLDHEEVKLALGALVSILDKNKTYPLTPEWVRNECNKWRTFYLSEVHKYGELNTFVKGAVKKIAHAKIGRYFKSTLLDIFYHIINQEPFANWCEDVERGVRLGSLTSIMEAYTSTPIPNHLEVDRGGIRTSKKFRGELSWWWRHEFYNAFVTLMLQQGVNDPEDEEVINPPGYVPFMTVHQAKGLEFPVVFVARIDEEAEPGSEHRIEDETNQFRKSYVPASTPQQRAEEDLIRFYYVAYSRAQHALFLLLNITKVDLTKIAGRPIGLGGRTSKLLNGGIKIWSA